MINETKITTIFAGRARRERLQITERGENFVNGYDYVKTNKITDLEADFGVIRATRQKVKSLIPHPNSPQSKGFCICPFFEDHFEMPTFSVSVYSDYGMIPAPRWALFEVVGGKWFMVQTGDYAHRVDEMIEVLISVFGGERG